VSKNLRLALKVFNPFDSRASDIDCYCTSRLKGEPAAGIDDMHFHPVEPRNFRVTASALFQARLAPSGVDVKNRRPAGSRPRPG
jgi:hypothetical protein